ncbi:Kinesin-like protein Klp98A-like, partial [Homarus americanus]
EVDLNSVCIVEVDDKKTRLINHKVNANEGESRERIKDFTFDFSYWSHSDLDRHFAPQIFGFNGVMFAWIWLCHPSKKLETWSSPVMSKLFVNVCIVEVVYERISFRWQLLQFLEYINHVILWDEGQSW